MFTDEAVWVSLAMSAGCFVALAMLQRYRRSPVTWWTERRVPKWYIPGIVVLLFVAQALAFRQHGNQSRAFAGAAAIMFIWTIWLFSREPRFTRNSLLATLLWATVLGGVYCFPPLTLLVALAAMPSVIWVWFHTR
jgi:hypothetical protein